MRASFPGGSSPRRPRRLRSGLQLSAACAGLSAGLAAGLIGHSVALAQQPGWQQQQPQQQQPPQKSQAPSQQQPRAKQPSKAESGAGSGTPGTDASLRQRVEQLEEQLVDLQVVVGTVESLARAGGASSASAAYRNSGPAPSMSPGSGADTGRIAALETQVQALTVQLEQMTQQLRQLQAGGAPPPRGPSGPAPRTGGGFGSTTVTTADDPIANLINAPDPRMGAAPRTAPAPSSSAAGRQQYDAAYSQLLQQNFAAAEAGFLDFLRAYPQDELAPNAQFWLGETYFVREQWDSAASAFLKVGQSFPRSDKAPDSFAKLAVSMERKGNKAAACRALQELNARYPNAPAHVRNMEASTRRRAGCT